MPNSRQTSVMASPSRSRATKRRRSSITELAFHGIHTSRRSKAESVTHVSGTFCHLCLGPLRPANTAGTFSFGRCRKHSHFLHAILHLVVRPLSNVPVRSGFLPLGTISKPTNAAHHLAVTGRVPMSHPAREH